MADGLARHDLVWLDPRTAQDIAVDDVRLLPLVEQWVTAGHPAVVRRQDGSPAVGESAPVALGIPLPTRLGRLRLAFQVPARVIRQRAQMPLLVEAIASAPQRLREILRHVEGRLANANMQTRTYGSLGWQHITGETYLHSGSDVDILMEPNGILDRQEVVRAFADLAALDAPRFDGEFLAAADRAVAWRELVSPSREILVRGLRDLHLVSPQAIWDLITCEAPA